MQIARLLLQHLKSRRISVSFPDATGKTLLHDAILARNIPLARLLIACGASLLDPSWKDAAGKPITPIDALFFLEAQQAQNKNVTGRVAKTICAALVGLPIAYVTLAILVTSAVKGFPDFSSWKLFFNSCDAIHEKYGRCLDEYEMTFRVPACMQAIYDRYKGDLNVLQSCANRLPDMGYWNARACQETFSEEISDCMEKRRKKSRECAAQEEICKGQIPLLLSEDERLTQLRSCLQSTVTCVQNIFTPLCTSIKNHSYCSSNSYNIPLFHSLACKEQLYKEIDQCELIRKKQEWIECSKTEKKGNGCWDAEAQTCSETIKSQHQADAYMQQHCSWFFDQRQSDSRPAGEHNHSPQQHCLPIPAGFCDQFAEKPGITTKQAIGKCIEEIWNTKRVAVPGSGKTELQLCGNHEQFILDFALKLQPKPTLFQRALSWVRLGSTMTNSRKKRVLRDVFGRDACLRDYDISNDICDSVSRILAQLKTRYSGV